MSSQCAGSPSLVLAPSEKHARAPSQATAIQAGPRPTRRLTTWVEDPACDTTSGSPFTGLPCSTNPAWQFEQQNPSFTLKEPCLHLGQFTLGSSYGPCQTSGTRSSGYVEPGARWRARP